MNDTENTNANLTVDGGENNKYYTTEGPLPIAASELFFFLVFPAIPYRADSMDYESGRQIVALCHLRIPCLTAS